MPPDIAFINCCIAASVGTNTVKVFVLSFNKAEYPDLVTSLLNKLSVVSIVAPIVIPDGGVVGVTGNCSGSLLQELITVADATNSSSPVFILF